MQPATSGPRTRLTLALTAILLLGLAAPAWPLNTQESRATLRGIPTIAVEVASLDPEAERVGLTKNQLQTDVELRLRKAGINVVSSPSGETAWSLLGLRVTFVKVEQLPLYAFDIRLEFFQMVILLRDPGLRTVGSTWSINYTGFAGAGRTRGVRDAVADLVDEFINAYLEQNPKQ